MCKNGEGNGGEKRKMPKGNVFTPMNARQAQEASVRARNLRKQMRAQMLDAAINEGIDKLFIKAMKSGDSDMMECISKAIKIVGLSHDQSEDAVQKIAVDANVDANVDAKVKTVKFVLDKPCPDQPTT